MVTQLGGSSEQNRTALVNFGTNCLNVSLCDFWMQNP